MEGHTAGDPGEPKFTMDEAVKELTATSKELGVVFAVSLLERKR